MCRARNRHGGSFKFLFITFLSLPFPIITFFSMPQRRTKPATYPVLPGWLFTTLDPSPRQSPTRDFFHPNMSFGLVRRLTKFDQPKTFTVSPWISPICLYRVLWITLLTVLTVVFRAALKLRVSLPKSSRFFYCTPSSDPKNLFDFLIFALSKFFAFFRVSKFLRLKSVVSYRMPPLLGDLRSCASHDWSLPPLAASLCCATRT